eukprot:NODE_665_length_5410_cov_0.165317.p1 type:complete len:549 gc:universal NODE_665_length_5410_cov_0.165317:3340-4986(+)
MEFDDISHFKKDSLHRQVLNLKDEIRILSQKQSLSSIESENIELKNKIRQLQSGIYMKIFGMEPKSESPINSPPVEQAPVNHNGHVDVNIAQLKGELEYYKQLSASSDQPVNITFSKKTEFSYKSEYLKVKSEYDDLLTLYNAKQVIPVKTLELNWQDKELSQLNADLIRIRASRDTYKSQMDELKANYSNLEAKSKSKDEVINQLKSNLNLINNQYSLAQMQLNQSDAPRFSFWQKQSKLVENNDSAYNNVDSSCPHELWISELNSISIPVNEIANNVPLLIQKYSALAVIEKHLRDEQFALLKKCRHLETATSQLYEELTKSQSQKQDEINKCEKTQSKLMHNIKQKDQLKNSYIASEAKNKELLVINKELQEKAVILQEIIQKYSHVQNEMDYRMRPMDIRQQQIVDGYKLEIEELNLKLMDATDNYATAKNNLITLSKSNKSIKNELNAQIKRIETIKRNITQSGGDFTKLEQIQGQEAVDTLEQYKALLKCSACNINFKSQVITKCWHMFCEDCINSRIETRQRKCPSCSDSFGIHDIKPIYF